MPKGVYPRKFYPRGKGYTWIEKYGVEGAKARLKTLHNLGEWMSNLSPEERKLITAKASKTRKRNYREGKLKHHIKGLTYEQRYGKMKATLIKWRVARASSLRSNSKFDPKTEIRLMQEIVRDPDLDYCSFCDKPILGLVVYSLHRKRKFHLDCKSHEN